MNGRPFRSSLNSAAHLGSLRFMSKDFLFRGCKHFKNRSFSSLEPSASLLAVRIRSENQTEPIKSIFVPNQAFQRFFSGYPSFYSRHPSAANPCRWTEGYELTLGYPRHSSSPLQFTGLRPSPLPGGYVLTVSSKGNAGG